MKLELVRISPQATKSRHDSVATIDSELIGAKVEHARTNDRRREIHILHEGDHDPLQRMLNALQPGSYVPPHRHDTPPKAETIVLLQGSLGFVPFHDDGECREEEFIHVAEDSKIVGVDCRAGGWHTFFALEPDTVVFEVKPGPFNPASDKEFARWAPLENDPGAQAYLADLEDRFRARFGLPPRSWRPGAPPE